MRTTTVEGPITSNAKNFFEAAEDTIVNLKGRWMDESEYEDIKDYKLPLLSIAKKHNVVINRMKKSPFGCIFTTNNMKFQLGLKDRSYFYKRIK